MFSRQGNDWTDRALIVFTMVDADPGIGRSRRGDGVCAIRAHMDET